MNEGWQNRDWQAVLDLTGEATSGVDVEGYCMFMDELREAYAVAEQRTAELDAVMESIPHAVFIQTAGGEVRLNRRALEMTGGRFPAQLHTMERALQGEASTETVLSEKRWITSVAVPIRCKERILGGVAVNTDVTQERRREDVLRRSEKLVAVGQLASSIAHEINNPLESLTNLLYLIRGSDRMEEVHEYAAIAQRELTRVSEITVQTLRFHRQQASATRVDLAELLQSILSLYSGRFLVRGVGVAWRLVPASPVFCIEGEIRQVLNNLVRNAIDAMSEGGRLQVRVRPECGRARRPGVRITIADVGEGISGEIMAHLFEPFYTTKDVTGTGLGLWVSKGIVDKHGGTIVVRTRTGERHGTVFAIWLPVENPGLIAAESGEAKTVAR